VAVVCVVWHPAVAAPTAATIAAEANRRAKRDRIGHISIVACKALQRAGAPLPQVRSAIKR
jgi:hypothetical protein